MTSQLTDLSFYFTYTRKDGSIKYELFLLSSLKTINKDTYISVLIVHYFLTGTETQR